MEIQAKTDEHAALLLQFRELGGAAGEISASVRAIGELKNGDRTSAATLDQLVGLEQHMTTIVERARVLLKAAQEAGMGDLARDVESMHKQVQSARNKVGLLRAKLAR